MIKLIAFDLNGVLLRSGHLVSENLMSFVNKPYPFVKKKYILYSLGRISREEFWKAVGIPPEVGEKKLAESVEINFDINWLKSLKNNYRLAIFSNLPREWIDILLFDRIPKEMFDFVILSGDVGARKPDGKMYKSLLEKSGFSSNEILFIDDKKSNLMVAKEIGMVTVWMKGKGDDAPFEPDFTIKNLSELNNLLGR